MRDGEARGWVGRSIRRVEDPALLRGEGRFTADLPARHWVRFVRSPVASGRLTGLHAPPGVRVFSAADLVGVAPIRPIIERFGYACIEQPVLAQDVVRYVGDLVAAVVAPSREAAEDAAELVQLQIEPIAPVMDAQAAQAEAAHRIHANAPGNVVVDARMQTAGFAGVAGRTVSASIRSHRQNGLPLECRAAHASFDGGRITLTCTTQMPHLARTAIADLLGLDERDLRVVAPDIGGGFGQKMSLAPEYVVVTWLARRLRASVGWVEDRRENLMASFHSRDMAVSVHGIFDDEARLLALDADVVANVGAYAPFPNTAAVEPLMSMAELPGPYAVQEYRCRARGVVTNTCPSAPYRGVARPAITLAMERLMDRAAAAFGLDAAEIRRRNLIARFPHTTPTGLVYDQGTYRQTLDLALQSADVPAFRQRQAAALAEGRYLGLGFSSFCERTGYGSAAFAARGMPVTPGWETVQLAMDPSGFVEARIGASPHGQGLRTTLAQIIADELGLAPDRVRVVHGDTDRTPYGWGTFASRSLVISGGACKLAAGQLRDRLAALAAQVLEASAADIVLQDGRAVVAGTDRSVALAALARTAHHRVTSYAPGTQPGLTEQATYDPAGTFSNACHLAIVEVDVETYAVRIERFIVAEDAGQLINPMIVEGQIRGGVAQGIANALYEEIVYDEGGDILTTTLADYLPPTAHEIPQIEIHHLETLTDASVTRAKGVGEGGTIGAPAAVVAAINDALAPLGAALDAIPATPRRIRDAIRDARR